MDATLDFEVLSPGQYHHFPAFTVEHLDEIVANFEALKPYVRPPLKAGHSSNQILVGQSDGDPALGWCTKLRRVGDKLVGTFAGIPQKFADLINKGRYRTGSSEIHMAWESSQDEANLKTGRKGRVFQGFAVLGADLPAVKDLSDLSAFYGSATPLQVSAPTDAATAHIDRPLHLSGYAPDSLLEFADDVRELVAARYPGAMDCCGGFVRDLFPDRVIVDPGDGDLVQHTLTIGPDGEPTLDEPPIPVAITYAPTQAEMSATGSRPQSIVAEAASSAQETHMSEPITKPADDTAALDAKFADMEARFTAKLAEKDAAHAAALAERDAKIATLSQKHVEADTRARRLASEQFVAKFSDAGNLRILPALRPLATVLHERLSAMDATVAADQLTACFSAGETPTDLSLVALLERFIAGQPDHKQAVVELTQHTDPTPNTAMAAVEQYVELKAKELGKNPKDPVIRAEMTKLCASERPDLIRAAQAG